MDMANINRIGIVILGVALTFLSTWFWRYRTRVAKEKEDLMTRLAKMDDELMELSTKISPFWAAVQSKIVKDLTHPSPQFAEMDELMRKLDALTITEDERVRLQVLLNARIVSTDPEVSDDEKGSAKIMEEVMLKVVRGVV